MLFEVTCHCGRSIGDLYPLYCEMRREVVDEELKRLNRDIAPDRAHLIQDFKPQLGNVLDQLEIKLECCRTRFLTSVDFESLYA